MVYFLGARPYSFKDEETGKQIEGVTAWYCDDTGNEAVGFIPWKASYSHEAFAKIYGKLAELESLAFRPVELVCNRFGKPESVVFLEAE